MSATSEVAKTSTTFADPIAMQHRLFAELSAMFGKEVPLYDKALAVNQVTNTAVCDLLARKHQGFSISEELIERTSGERHGAIRIGTPDEYFWIAGFFAAFGMEPHNFYDMTALGAKSQPIIATAFRSRLNPEHRVFSSLLMIEQFDPETRVQIRELLAGRQVFSDRAKELVTKNTEQGGLTEAEAEELIAEGTTRIFKWTARARDYALYEKLCEAGFKIAADIACFESHHLNHLTPNTFSIDLYTAAMKFAMGETTEEIFRADSRAALEHVRTHADGDFLKLHFRHLTLADVRGYNTLEVPDAVLDQAVEGLVRAMRSPELDLTKLNHSGYKDFTEGPPATAPILLRQDSYKALTEPVVFRERDGSTRNAVHTARFGEIEQRFYATTPKGRALYDETLTRAEAARHAAASAAKSAGATTIAAAKAGTAAYNAEFESVVPATLQELLAQGLVFGRYAATEQGKARGVTGATRADLSALIASGDVDYEGLRYEDFLPFSAAGIFASNLGQYGTKSEGGEQVVYTKETLETIMKRRIVDPTETYAALEAESIAELRQ